MKRIILAAFLAAFAVPALAQFNIGSGTQANSDASAKSLQQQGLTNAPTNIIEASQIPSNTTLKNVPSIAIGGPASGPCNGLSAGVGVSGMGFSVLGNLSKVDENCEERETARIAALIGRMDIANLVLEEMEVVKRAQERRAAKQAQKKAEALPAATPVAQRPQLVAASTMITPSEQTRAVCDNARLTGDNILASRLGCPK